MRIIMVIKYMKLICFFLQQITPERKKYYIRFYRFFPLKIRSFLSTSNKL